MISIEQSDILEWAKAYKGEPFHALLCDPPYHLTSIVKRFGKPNSAPAKDRDGVFQRASRGFMGQEWDGGEIAFDPETWRLIGQHLYPGAFGMAYAGSRGYHRLATAIEDAGFIIHPAIAWLNVQGFPKATRVKDSEGFEGYRYGLQALKPMVEFICVFQRPYEGRPLENITQTGAGAINVDAGRIGGIPPESFVAPGYKSINQTNLEAGYRPKNYYKDQSGIEYNPNSLGRWPGNFVASHLSLPVMRLAGNLPDGTIEAIGRYYHGYDRVRKLRERTRNNSVQKKRGTEVLQSGMQERIVQENKDANAGVNEVSDVRQRISSAGSMGEGGKTEVLRQEMRESLPENTGRGDVVEVREETYGGVEGQNISNAHETTLDAKNGKTPNVERGEIYTEGIYIGNDWITDEGRTGISDTDEFEGEQVYSGTQASDGKKDREAANEGRGGSSHKWNKKRQSTGESYTGGERETLIHGEGHREADNETRRGEQAIEVIIDDIPGEWLEYFEATGENLGCKIVGKATIDGYVINRFEDGMKPFGEGAGHEYEGEEVAGQKVDIYECAQDCPIGQLNEQAGILTSGMMQAGTHRNQDGGYNGHFPNEATTHPTYGDSGGIGRFFYQANWNSENEEQIDEAFPVNYEPKVTVGEREAGMKDFEIQKSGYRPNDPEENSLRTRLHNEVGRHNNHPTLKPIDLSRWLAGLLLPPDKYKPRRLLVPFSGASSEMIGAWQAGWDEILGVESVAEYVEIGRARIEYWSKKRGWQPSLF